jgi:hypothetical protein
MGVGENPITLIAAGEPCFVGWSCPTTQGGVFERDALISYSCAGRFWAAGNLVTAALAGNAVSGRAAIRPYTALRNIHHTYLAMNCGYLISQYSYLCISSSRFVKVIARMRPPRRPLARHTFACSCKRACPWRQRNFQYRPFAVPPQPVHLTLIVNP